MLHSIWRWTSTLMFGALAGLLLTAAYVAWGEARFILMDPEFINPRPTAMDALVPLAMLAVLLALGAASLVTAVTRPGVSWIRAWAVAAFSGLVASLLDYILTAIDWELPWAFGAHALYFWYFGVFLSICAAPPLVFSARRPAWLVIPIGVVVVAIAAVGDRLYFSLGLNETSAPIVMLALVGIGSGALCAGLIWVVPARVPVREPPASA